MQAYSLLLKMLKAFESEEDDEEHLAVLLEHCSRVKLMVLRVMVPALAFSVSLQLHTMLYFFSRAHAMLNCSLEATQQTSLLAYNFSKSVVEKSTNTEKLA